MDDGQLVMTIGREFEPAEKWSGRPFHTPTNMAVSPVSGDVYITDGYGNSRVHRYAPDGRHLNSWGAPGVAPGEFQIPHNVVIDRDELVFVTDRENHRLQVFDKHGQLQDIWRDIYRPQALCMDRSGLLYIGEMLQIPELKDCPGVGHNLNVFSHTGQRLAHLGDPTLGDSPTEFIAPHGFGVDSAGNLYVGEVSYTVYGQRLEPKQTFKSFRRLTRLKSAP
jgi:DNA-binding beta-propeller fold protein YncE